MSRSGEAPPKSPQRAHETLLTPAFVAVTSATMLYFLAYGTVTPVLPHFVTRNLGQGNFAVGVTVGAFAVSAILTRPLAGRLGNWAGRRWLMLIGAAIAGSSIAAYGLASNLFVLILLRLATGVGEGFFYTGSATIVSDLAPPERRGEAISLYSVAIWVGNGVGPAIGQSIYRASGARASFWVAAGFCAAAIALSLRVPQMRVIRQPGESHPPLINRRALAPGSVLALAIAGTTAFNAYVPLYADRLHMGGSQYVFLLYAVIVLSVRIFLKRLPDLWGPRRTGSVATSGLALGFVIIAATGSTLGLYLGTVVVALGNSLIFPALMAMAISGAEARERASIVGTFSGFFDLSSGFGGLTLGLVASLAGYRVCFASGAAYAAAGLGLLRSRGLSSRERRNGDPHVP